MESPRFYKVVADYLRDIHGFESISNNPISGLFVDLKHYSVKAYYDIDRNSWLIYREYKNQQVPKWIKS